MASRLIFCNCNVGVRQGENLSPLLFHSSLTIGKNSLLVSVGGITIGVRESSTVENEFFLYVKL